jgi:nucleoside-diphosphate-sugar epimerase
MSERKQTVLLTGASGSMGFETFKLLWEKGDRYDIVLLLRPSKKNKKQFRRYEREARAGGEDRGSLRIVWGDVLVREDVEEACRGIDFCLHPMALISPEADRQPEMADLVNARGTRCLVEAIEHENPEHIRLVHVSTVAEYGHRLPPVHLGRTGDPVMPSAYDHYAISKIKGELAVMQSRIRHKVSLRQTFIMIPQLLSLKDPIMFHQPINSMMENITARDSGRLLVSCLEMPDDSDFWGEYYNISGGPGCRTSFLELLDGIYSMLGIRYDRVMERSWFALKNFHMLFYEDSKRLNDYLHHWEGGQSLEDYFGEVWKNLPWYLKVTAWYNRYIPPYRALVEAITRRELKKLAYHHEGTMGWIRNKDHGRINAFYGSMEAYNSIPGWDPGKPSENPALDHHQEHIGLKHGYDESKAELEMKDLQGAAAFRGGALVSKEWDGNMEFPLSWICCQQHPFTMTPHAVLKGGHWCMECISPPWNYHLLNKKNPFAAQVLSPSGL